MEGKTNGLSIAGFVVSLVTLFIFGFYGIGGTVGILLSFFGKQQAKREGGSTSLATAGMVIGLISVFLTNIGLFMMRK